MLQATEDKTTGTPEYKEALTKTLKELAKECQTRGTYLNKLITK